MDQQQNNDKLHTVANDYSFSAYVPPQPPPHLAGTPAPNGTSPNAPEYRLNGGAAPYRRRISLMVFVLVFLFGLLMIPSLSEQIVYGINRGRERAKAEVARKLLDEIRDPEQRIPWVVKAVEPSVVGIRTAGTGMGVGSGVIVDKEGYILTNNHVIANAQFVSIRLSDGRTVEQVGVVGCDPASDLAVLKIDDSHLQAIPWGDSSTIEVGDQVVAIGNPFDLSQTVTSGIISATERFNPIPSRGTRVQEFLQTDAAINPGNSGGALVNMRGELIGINTAILSESGGNLGIGFAIPSILAKKIYDEIRQHGEVKHGWLGIYMEPTTAQYAEMMKLEKPRGVVVARFLTPSPAKDAGLKVGDVIIKWGQTEVRDPLHLSHLIILSKPGTTEPVEIVRKGETQTVEVTLGTRPVELQ